MLPATTKRESEVKRLLHSVSIDGRVFPVPQLIQIMILRLELVRSAAQPHPEIPAPVSVM